MTEIDKKLVCRRFGRHLTSYDANAHLQHQMAERLLTQLLRTTGRPAWPRVLEIGCGSGGLSRLIAERLQCGRLWLNDLVPDCAAAAANIAGAVFLPGDIETLILPESLDLILSNAALQWVGDLPRLLVRLRAALQHGGVLAFTTFGPATCREIGQLCQVALPYRSLDELTALLAAQFEVLEKDEAVRTLGFSEPAAVLRHLKATGVSGAGRPEYWTRGRLAAFYAEYRQKFPFAGGVGLTYQPIRFIVRKN